MIKFPFSEPIFYGRRFWVGLFLDFWPEDKLTSTM